MFPTKWRLKKNSLDKFHRSPYTAHPRYHKLFSTMKKNYFWPGMRKYIMEYLVKCLEFQQVKVEH